MTVVRVPAKTPPALSPKLAPAVTRPAQTAEPPKTQTAPLPTAAQASATASSPVGGGGYVLQIGSYKSEAEANASWQAYKGAHSAASGFAPNVRRAELGAKGTWYRLRLGPFASLSEANAACAKLKASGGSCFPAKQ